MDFKIGDKIFEWEIMSTQIKGVELKTGTWTHSSHLIKCKCGAEMVTRKTKLSKLILSGGSRELQKCCKKCILTSNRENKSKDLFYGKIYSHYKSSAKKRNLDFNLSKLTAVNLFESNCVFCGDKASNNFDNVTYTGIDRIDSSKGYIEGNVQPCCKQCNVAKQDLSDSNFLSHITKIYKHLIEGSSTIPFGSTLK